MLAHPVFNVPQMASQQPSPASTEEGQPSNASAPRTSRKRKSPPAEQLAPQQQPPPHLLPPPHALMQFPPGFAYPPPPGDFTPAGMPPALPSGESNNQQSAGRALSQSKRAEQNRKAQRAFRERRDQHVKALESRSQLLDAALASADEANRRWEECRALVDQLRVENAALRAHLAQHLQNLPPGAIIAGMQPQPGSAVAPADDKKPDQNGEQKEEERE